MIVARQRCDGRIADRGHGLDGRAVFLQAEPAAGQDFLIAARMQIGKAAGKFDFLAIHGDRSVGALALVALRLRDVLVVHRQEPAHPGMLVFQIARCLGVRAVMHDVVLQVAENVVQHVEEMHADVGGDAAGFLQVALPGLKVPMAARGNVGEVHLVLGVFALGTNLVPQGDDGRMHPQLQDGVDPVPRVALDLEQAVDVPGVEHQRLFTDRIGTRAQGKTHVRIVQVVGRTDRYVVDVFRFVGSPHLVDMPVEALELGKELRIREMTVDDAY